MLFAFLMVLDNLLQYYEECNLSVEVIYKLGYKKLINVKDMSIWKKVHNPVYALLKTHIDPRTF